MKCQSLHSGENKKKYYQFPSKHSLKSIVGRYRPVRVADRLITARYRFIKNASWVVIC